LADFAQSSVDLEADALKDNYLIFSIGSESYGIEVRHVTEIVGIQHITTVPELPMYIKGLINLRGSVIPVMDVRLRFGKEPKEYTDRTCIIVVNVKSMSFGLIVDAVSEVLSIPEEDIVDPPMSEMNNGFVKGIGKVNNGVKLLIDCKKILAADEILSA